VSSVAVDNGEDSNGSISETGIEMLLVLGPDEGGATNCSWWLVGALLGSISDHLGWV